MSSRRIPSELVDAGDAPEVLALLHDTLRALEAATPERGHAFPIPPGPLWLLQRQEQLTFDSLCQALRDAPLMGAPLWFHRSHHAPQLDALRATLLGSIQRASDAGVTSPQDACRILAAATQTLFSSNQELVARNHRCARLGAARQAHPELGTEALFTARRPDERGCRVATSQLQAIFASHIGPAYADKLENQDAACAITFGETLVFALADGVSTSLGAREAATAAAFRFCKTLGEASEGGGMLTTASLLAAVAHTQRSMDSLLDELLDDRAPELLETLVATSRMQPRAIRAVLENTRTAERSSLAPAFATTLIGGYLQPASDGLCTGAFVALGDGVVEKITCAGVPEQLLATDAELFSIPVSLAPGPVARAFLAEGALVPVAVTLNRGEHLLVSSDGLARGHAQPVWQQLGSLLGNISPRLRQAEEHTAAELLVELTERATRESTGKLFNDNVSLILITAS